MSNVFAVLPDPRFLSFNEWASFAMNFTNTTAQVPLPEYLPWQDWATAFGNAPAIRKFQLPNPYQFTEWDSWAKNVIRVTKAGQ